MDRDRLLRFNLAKKYETKVCKITSLERHGCGGRRSWPTATINPHWSWKPDDVALHDCGKCWKKGEFMYGWTQPIHYYFGERATKKLEYLGKEYFSAEDNFQAHL